MTGYVHQINIKPFVQGERGLPKYAVAEARITANGLEGDHNNYRSKKGNDPDKAVLIMPLEMIAQLNSEGWPVKPGDIGENITTRGIPYDSFSAGKRYTICETVLEISKPCTPCKNLGRLPYAGADKTPEFIKTILNRRGWYARVIREGMIRTGDAITELV